MPPTIHARRFPPRQNVSDKIYQIKKATRWNMPAGRFVIRQKRLDYIKDPAVAFRITAAQQRHMQQQQFTLMICRVRTILRLPNTKALLISSTKRTLPVDTGQVSLDEAVMHDEHPLRHHEQPLPHLRIC